jgi:trehalose utilization protein
LKGTHPGTIPARFGLIWFSGFRGEDLNVRSSLTYILGFSVKFFFQPIYTDYAN